MIRQIPLPSPTKLPAPSHGTDNPPLAQAYTRGTVDDFGNGSYDAWITPTVAGPYYVSVALDDQASGPRSRIFVEFSEISISMYQLLSLSL